MRTFVDHLYYDWWVAPNTSIDDNKINRNFMCMYSYANWICFGQANIHGLFIWWCVNCALMTSQIFVRVCVKKIYEVNCNTLKPSVYPPTDKLTQWLIVTCIWAPSWIKPSSQISPKWYVETDEPQGLYTPGGFMAYTFVYIL